jgi:methionine-rich copper-binding protein CopC
MIHDLCHAVAPVYALRWLAVACLIPIFPTSLLAHGTLLRADPAVNSQVAERPSEVRLWFNESIERRFSRVTVHRAERDATTGEFEPQQRVDAALVEGHRITRELAVKLPATLAPGVYLVQWQVLSIDSHRTSGKFTLTYAPRTDQAKPTR